MAEYAPIAQGFARLRARWKRSAATAGATQVAVDALAFVTILALVNALFPLHTAVRVTLWAAAAAELARQFFLHVLRPLARRVTDAQLALYVEERSPEFEGALLAAAEFGPEQMPRDDPQRNALVAAILQSAERRLARVDWSRAFRADRLKKFAWIGAGLLALHALAAWWFPDTARRTVAMAVNPFYEPPPEDDPFSDGRDAPPPPLALALTRDHQTLPDPIRVARGGVLALKAHLNRDPAAEEGAPAFHFRATAAESPETEDDARPWNTLPFDAIEEAFGYALDFPDINESLEFEVSAGPARTKRYRVEAIDPLTVTTIHASLVPPDYLALPAREEAERDSFDLSAVVGTHATFRLAANNPLASGTLTWGDGRVMAVTPDPEDPRAATVAFTVSVDGHFTLALRDADGQPYESPVPAVVRALPDRPPTVTAKKPIADVSVHPLGQVTIEAAADDDWGLASATLVYVVGQDADARPTRVPLELSPADDDADAEAETPPATTPPPTRARLRTALQLASVQPPLKAGDVVTYHLETEDRKGQRAATDVYFIFITPFEAWTAWNPLAPHAPSGAHETMLAPLEKFVAAAWHLKRERDRIPPEEYRARCEALAAKFETVDPATGQPGLIRFLEALP